MKVIKDLTILFFLLAAFIFVIYIFPHLGIYTIEQEENIVQEEVLLNSDLLEKEVQKINQKVVPYKVLAKVKIRDEEFVGEVLEDRQNGENYHISNETHDDWYEKYMVEILYPDEMKVEPLSDEEIVFYVNYQKMTSKTDYLLWVDLYRNETYLLKKNEQFFDLLKRFNCSTGENITPTKRGLFEIKNKGSSFIGRSKDYICYNYLQYDGSYLLHSFPYDFDFNVLDNRLKQRVSTGCVRFTFEDSLYLYKTIPLNTAIWIN